tara:strand:- start:3660 stop:5393 length:1734 start_codon:yes stop_codon:yes gene_type:complete
MNKEKSMLILILIILISCFVLAQPVKIKDNVIKYDVEKNHAVYLFDDHGNSKIGVRNLINNEIVYDNKSIGIGFYSNNIAIKNGKVYWYSDRDKKDHEDQENPDFLYNSYAYRAMARVGKVNDLSNNHKLFWVGHKTRIFPINCNEYSSANFDEECYFILDRIDYDGGTYAYGRPIIYWYEYPKTEEGQVFVMGKQIENNKVDELGISLKDYERDLYVDDDYIYWAGKVNYSTRINVELEKQPDLLLKPKFTSEKFSFANKFQRYYWYTADDNKAVFLVDERDEGFWLYDLNTDKIKKILSVDGSLAHLNYYYLYLKDDMLVFTRSGKNKGIYMCDVNDCKSSLDKLTSDVKNPQEIKLENGKVYYLDNIRVDDRLRTLGSLYYIDLEGSSDIEVMSKEFGSNIMEISEITQIQSTTPESVKSISNDVISDKAKSNIDDVKTALDDGLVEPLPVTKTYTGYEIISETGEKIDATLITIEIKALKTMYDIVLIESIPKSYAQSIDDIKFIGIQPIEILQADPIVKFYFKKMNAGEKKEIKYVVPEKVVKPEAKSITVYDTQGGSWLTKLWMWFVGLFV